VINDEENLRNMRELVVPLIGSLEQTEDPFRPYRLLDGRGVTVEPVAAFFAELTACGRPATTQRSYGMDLLRWLRFLWALGVEWDQATRVEARDFIRWLQVTVRPDRPHCRAPAKSLGDAEQSEWAGAVAGVVSVGGGDVGDSGEAEDADGGVS
jgi:hypothetical protein